VEDPVRIHGFLTVILTGILLVASSNVFASGLLSYKEWKQEKIQNANFQLIAKKAQIQSLKSKLTYPDFARSPKLQTLQQEANQLEWNLEVAQDLAVKDYLVLYLAPQQDEKRFVKAAAKLTVSDVAEVLDSYTKSIEAPKIRGQNSRLSTEMPFSK
jgi:hypothetical protein